MHEPENSTSRFEDFTDYRFLSTAFQFLFSHTLKLIPSTMWLYTDTTIPENIHNKGKEEVGKYRIGAINSQVTDSPNSNVEIKCTSVFSPDHTHKKLGTSFAEFLAESKTYYPYIEAALTRIFSYSIANGIRDLVINTTNLMQLESIHRQFQGTQTNDHSNFATNYILAQYPAGIIQVAQNKFYIVQGQMNDVPYLQMGSTLPARVIQQTVKLYDGSNNLSQDQLNLFAYSRNGRGDKWEDAWEEFVRLHINPKFKPQDSFTLYSLPVTLLGK